MKILLTGGAGYIGSHTALALAAAGHDPILLDDFSNSGPAVVDRLSQLAGRELALVRGNAGDRDLLKDLFASHDIEAVMHFSARKSVAESVADPLSYHLHNVGGMLAMLEAMDAAGVRTIVFSSSATVYGDPDSLPIPEDHPIRAVNPYGQTKLICEKMLSDLALSERGWRVSLLRYFNPVGAHPSGLIGEESRGTPTNLMPLIARVALGQSPQLQIFGRDYPTADGPRCATISMSPISPRAMSWHWLRLGEAMRCRSSTWAPAVEPAFSSWLMRSSRRPGRRSVAWTRTGEAATSRRSMRRPTRRSGNWAGEPPAA